MSKPITRFRKGMRVRVVKRCQDQNLDRFLDALLITMPDGSTMTSREHMRLVDEHIAKGHVGVVVGTLDGGAWASIEFEGGHTCGAYTDGCERA